MRKKKEHHEEHADESWLLPYSDVLTLLLALFIVMFAMSQTDKVKLKAMGEQFNIIFAGGSGTLEKDGSSIIPMEQSGTSGTSGAASSTAAGDSNTAIEEDKMTAIKKMLEQEIGKEGYSDKVKVELNNDGLEIAIQDVVLFNSGEADVLKGVSPLISKITNMLHELDNQIKIVGHTDNIPINNGKFKSNWDLSAMRAINVMNFMTSSGGINQDKVSIQAYAEHMPKFTNDTEAGRAKNRRVEIIVVRKYPVT